MNTNPDKIEIGTVPKNSREHVTASLSTFNGHKLIDVRIFADTDDGPRATAKGVNLNVIRLPELRRLLGEAEDKAREMGWLPPRTEVSL